MDYPPIGIDVCVTLADTTVMLAYWNDGKWWQGVAHDSNNWLVDAEVISWEWRTD